MALRILPSGATRSTILAMLLALAPLAAAWGASGQIVYLPGGAARPKNGLTMELDTRGVDANGYRAFKVKLTNSPAVPSTYDRQVRVILELQGWGAYGILSVSDVVDIPEGATSVEKTIAVPHDSHWSYVNIKVREGGQILKELSVNYVMLNTFGGGSQEGTPSLLFIDSDTPSRTQRTGIVASSASGIPNKDPLTYNLIDYRNVHAAIHDPNYSGSIVYDDETSRLADNYILSQVDSTPRVEMLPLPELPERWIDLSCYSIAFISRGDLARLAKQEPKRKQALQEWLSGGTVLVVYDAGEDFAHLAEIEKLLGLPPLPDADKKETAYRGWIPPDLATYNNQPKIYGDGQGYNNYPYGRAMGMVTKSGAYSQIPESKATTTDTAPQEGDPPAFLSRPASLGWLIAIPKENPFPGKLARWEWMLRSIPDSRESWIVRHGMSLSGRNDGFWLWHIPGVGAAPVFSFMLLATLFAVAIGPLNYVLLGRIQRLYLLLITVPLGALVVTLCLFCYALVTDGLGMRARVRSFTDINQRSGDAVSWSRQTYFASIAPSRGLKFPADTTVFPLSQMPGEEGGRNHSMEWERDGQRLRYGFISSRSLEQFMVLRAGKSETKLEVTETKSRQSPPLVNNLLGTRAQLLILRSRSGDYFRAADLANKKTTQLEGVKVQTARNQLKALILAEEPKFPEGYDPALSGNAITRFFNGGNWYMNTGTATYNTRNSLLEVQLKRLTNVSEELLEKGTYLAVVDSSPEVPLGVEGARETHSLHLIRGRW